MENVLYGPKKIKGIILGIEEDKYHVEFENGASILCMDEELEFIDRPKQPQVDFEMLNKTTQNIQKEQRLWTNELQNIQLFFHLLSTKPTFAKVVHENLKRLNR